MDVSLFSKLSYIENKTALEKSRKAKHQWHTLQPLLYNKEKLQQAKGAD